MATGGPGGLRGDVGIRTPDQRLRVFVSSTLGELAEERRAVERAITALRLTPVMFELGARPHTPRALYRAYLEQSDIFIGLYWQQYGRVGPGEEISGLEEEFNLATDLPRLLYVKLPAPDREPRLEALVGRIRQENSYRKFQTTSELGRIVRDDLATLLSERFAAGRVQAGEHAPAAEPPPARPRGPRPLPVDPTSLVGRERAIDEAAGLIDRPEVRLVTLTGAGGIGKTRLAVAVAERVADRFPAGTAFAALAAESHPDLVMGCIARALGAEPLGAGAPLELIVERLGDGRWLLLLDNLEQVVEVARDLDDLLARWPGVKILATSRTELGLRAEREYPVPPLPLPAADPGEPLSLTEMAASPAVALFIDRARAVRYDFTLNPGNAAAVVEICRRLEGLPLAIELAAARIRLLDPEALLRRLSRSLDALGSGAVDLPERQRTLRATVDWSIGLLDASERSLLEVLAVFVHGWTTPAAASVAELDEEQAEELTEALARHSLVELSDGDQGPRPAMLETVRQFVAERLAAHPDAAEIGHRHADYYRTLAERADRPLRTAGWGEWADRLQAEAGNLAAAVAWYLANDLERLPHLFRVLLPLWALHDDMLIEARSWVDQMLPAADSLDPETRAELLTAAAVIAREVGDDTVARSARERLGPLLADIRDPYLLAVARLALAWTSAIVFDLDDSLQQAAASLEALQGQDEPLWTAAVLVTLGSVEIATGSYDAAFDHLTAMRALADESGNVRLMAASRVQLGVLAVARGQLEEARAHLDEGLRASLRIHSARNVTLCLAAFAELAFDEGDPARAARLMGAAEGHRRPAGLRPWPTVQRRVELVAKVREALGGERFDRELAAGIQLDLREALALAREHPGADATPR
jgi:predicted ATPase